MPTTVNSLEERIDEFSADVFSKFDSLEARFDILETRFDGLKTRFDILETKFVGLEKKGDD